MATASRPRPSAGPKQRPWGAGAWLALDTARHWLVPGGASLAIAGAAALAWLGLIAVSGALAVSIGALLVLLFYIGVRPLVAADAARRAQAIAAGLALFWLTACYLPFHARIFPGTPLVDGVEVTAAGGGLPVHIPASGHAAIDLLLEGKLGQNPTGGVAPPVHFRLTVGGGDPTPQVVEGTFEDSLRTQRLGRRGTAVVHQTHSAEMRVLPNPSRQDLTVTQLVLEPENAQPIRISAFAHPLPGVVVLTLAALVLLAVVVAFDRLGPVPDTDGALTLATAAVIGAIVIFWTSNAVHPDFSTLIGSAIFGGPLGFAAGALVWWIAKRLIVRPDA
jgi:hypothetical protein